MGLFDKLVKEIKSELKQGLQRALNSDSQPTAPPATVTPAAKAPIDTDNAADIIDYYEQYNRGDDYFAAMLTEDNFPGYNIEKNVHPNVFAAGAHPRCFPISYLFKKDGAPVLAVLTMYRNQSRAMIAVGTYNVLNANNIKYIRFYREMKNEESYVINRIRDNLN